MTVHRQRVSDSGSGHAGRERGIRIKPRAYIIRSANGNYDAKDDDGVVVASAAKFTTIDSECKRLGYAPVRFPDGDAPKKK